MSDAFLRQDLRRLAVISAEKRLACRGFEFDLEARGVDSASHGLRGVTAEISERFARLGLFSVLHALSTTARCKPVYEFDQYLFGRSYCSDERDPSVPFGFLFNLAVKAPDRPSVSQDRANDWLESIEMARDLVSILDVEPYSQFWAVNVTPPRMEPLLAEVGLYDHLFALRQWAISETPQLLQNFFGTSLDGALTAMFGWSATDAVRLSESLVKAVRTDPTRVTRAALLSTGLSNATLNSMLKRFVHGAGQVNCNYTSPLAAESGDLLFRPLIAGEADTFVAPAASIVGPACYEVVANAARVAASTEHTADFFGKGTERAVAALLRSRGLQPSFEGAKYNVRSAVDAGECDLVLEDASNILLVECKAKALTRATMSAKPGAALRDYGDGVIASQLQALQHERLLQETGEIVFEDGRRLLHLKRRVTRLTVTLLDHGSLQDRFLFINVVEPLLQYQMSQGPECPKRKHFLNRFRRELHASGRRNGSAWQGALGAASLSYGQLAAILVGVDGLATFIERICKSASYVSMNPLLEYYYMRMQGLFTAGISAR